MPPAPRIIRAGLDSYRPLSFALEFTKEDLAKIDEDIETTYWPGGVSDPALALPINLIPGNVANAGVIRLRKAPRYRAHVTIAGGCRAVAGAYIDERPYVGTVVGCRKELLIDKLSRGEHKLSIWTNGTERGDVAEWASASFTIGTENVDVPVVFTPSTEVTGRIANAYGGLLPGTGDAGVRLVPEEAFLGRIARSRPDPRGDFTVPNIAGPRHRVSFEPLPPGVVVKEIRYNNQFVADGVITLAPGAKLEILLDDQPATITGTAPADARIYIARWPFGGAIAAPYSFIATVDAAGAFRVGPLAAGEYRVVAVPGSSAYIDPPKLARLLGATPKVTLERGAQQSVELKLTDPSR